VSSLLSWILKLFILKTLNNKYGGIKETILMMNLQEQIQKFDAMRWYLYLMKINDTHYYVINFLHYHINNGIENEIPSILLNL